MKNKSILKVFGIMLLVTFILTWIIPSATIGTDGVIVGKIAPTGFADIFSCLEIITQYFAKPALFILFVGMFYGVINKSGEFKAVVNKITSVFKNKKWLFLALTILFYSVVTALTGIYLPMFMFMPLSIAILLGLKYTKIQSVFATVGASTIGLLGGISNAIIKSMVGVEGNAYLWVKVGLLVVLVALTVVYALKMKSKKEKTEANEEKIMFVPEKRNAKLDVKVKGISLYIVLGLLVVVFILGLTPWANAEIFNKAYTAIQNVKIGEFAIISEILGTFEVFGYWTYTSLIPTIALAIIVMALSTSLTFKEMLEGCVEGAKKVLSLAILSGLISLIVIFTLNSGFVGTIINFLAKGGNVALVTLSSFIAAPFMVDLSYAAQYILSMDYYVVGVEDLMELWGLVTQVAYSFAMLIAPSSILLLVGLGYVEESYSNWVKYIWKFLLAVLVASVAAILIASIL